MVAHSLNDALSVALLFLAGGTYHREHHWLQKNNFPSIHSEASNGVLFCAQNSNIEAESSGNWPASAQQQLGNCPQRRHPLIDHVPLAPSAAAPCTIPLTPIRVNLGMFDIGMAWVLHQAAHPRLLRAPRTHPRQQLINDDMLRHSSNSLSLDVHTPSYHLAHL